jgi:hypothetical protein
VFGTALADILSRKNRKKSRKNRKKEICRDEHFSRRPAMECQRCLLGKEAKYRVYTDLIDTKVCETCADEARRLGIAVEALDMEKEKTTEPKASQTQGLPADSWIIAANDGGSSHREPG